MTITRSAFLIMLCIPMMINADNFFDNTAGAIITSPANAQGVYNVDCSSSDIDALILLESKVCAVEDKIEAGLCQPTLISDVDVPLTITASGMYIVTQDLDIASTNTVITISADNVTIDLCGFKISGGTDVTGIVVSASQENVTIKNGVLAGNDYTADRLGTAIAVEAGASRVRIQDINIIDTQDIAIDLRSTDASPITNVTIERCRIDNPEIGIQVSEAAEVITIDQITVTAGRNYVMNCDASGGSTPITNLVITRCSVSDANTTASEAIVYLDDCEGAAISECVFFNNTLTGFFRSVVSVFDSSEITLSDIELYGNSVTTSNSSNAVLRLRTANNCSAKNIAIHDNSLLTGVNGFYMDGVTNSIFESCISSFNIALQPASPQYRDFYLLNSSDNNTFIACKALGNSTTSLTSYGFEIETSSDNFFIDCISSSHTATNDAHGFFVDTATSLGNKFIRCIASNNGDRGFYVLNGAVTNTEFKDCQALNNDEGFHLSSINATNVLLRNVACNNTTANYVQVGSVTGVITSAANANGWDNIDCSDATVNVDSRILTKVCAGLCEPTLIQDSDLPLTISTSGMYLVTENLDLLTSSTLITINADDVTIDMCGFEASGAYANDVTGIAIRSGHENITIKNGKFRDLTRGIIVEDTNDHVILEDLAFTSIQGLQPADSTINFAGSTNSAVRNITITDCGMQATATSTTIILFRNNNCFNFTIENIRFEANVATESGSFMPNFRLISLNNCENVMINNVKMQGNTSDNLLYGFIINACQSLSIENYMFAGNTSEGLMFGYRILGSSSFTIKDSLITNNSSTGSSFDGISMSTSSDMNFSRININNNNSDLALNGIFINSEDPANITVEDCMISSNMSGSGDMNAFYLSGVTDVIARRIMASNNTSYSSVTCSGFYVIDSQRIVFEDCQAFNNDNSATTSSQGFYLEDGAGSVQATLKNCIADTHHRAGFELDGATDTILIDCLAKNTDAGASGVGFRANATASSRIIFMGCIGEENALGFDVSGLSDSQFKDCIALGNATGFRLLSPSSNVEIKDCQAVFNASFGFVFTGTTTSVVLLRNVACDNGTNYFTPPAAAEIRDPIYSTSGWDNIDCP